MRNYYNKQRDNTEAQINYLYKTKDVTFRGFRFGVEHSSLNNIKTKNAGAIKINGLIDDSNENFFEKKFNNKLDK